VLYRIIDINNIQSNTTQLVILLRCISYIVWFNDMFWALVMSHLQVDC